MPIMIKQFYIRGLDIFPLILMARASLIQGTRPNALGVGAGDLRVLCFLALILFCAIPKFTI